MRKRKNAVEAEGQYLTPEQYRITRQKGTEPPYSGRYHNFKGNGTYHCACCGNALFSSTAKFNVVAKWPIFWAPVNCKSVKTAKDIFHFMIRNEVSCRQCSAHLGYVFENGRPPVGVRYFINSSSLSFTAKKEIRTQFNAKKNEQLLVEQHR